jgi:hypothetical protein
VVLETQKRDLVGRLIRLDPHPCTKPARALPTSEVEIHLCETTAPNDNSPRQPYLLTFRFHIFGTQRPFTVRSQRSRNSRISPTWSRSARPSRHHHHREGEPGGRGKTNTTTAAVTRRVAATSSRSAAPTARDALPRTRRSRDSPFATWSSPPPSVRPPNLPMLRAEILPAARCRR